MFVGWKLVDQWRAVQGQPLTIHLDWIDIVGSAAIVLGAYAVLIEAWRRILIAWKSALEFWPAARIMSISRLGLYVPGRVWQITMMTRMARQANVNPIAAAGSSVLNTVVNIAMGFFVALAAGWRTFGEISQGKTAMGVVLLLVIGGAIVVFPFVLPSMVALARRATGKQLVEATLPHRAVYLAIVANIVAWLLYGAAFELFVRGMTGSAPGSFADYVTVWAWSYIAGYLAFVSPGGLGVREAALAFALNGLHLATPATAAVVAVSSRLWLSVLEVVPGVLFLIPSNRSRSRAPTS